MTPTDVLEGWFESHRGQYVDVIIAGCVFGGRVQESMQKPTAFEFHGTSVCFRFGTTEQLTVEDPSGFRLGEFGQLIIPHATLATFGWHYYGREQTPENWCELTYRSRNGRIRLTRTGPLDPGEETFRYSRDRFVELL